MNLSEPIYITKPPRHHSIALGSHGESGHGLASKDFPTPTKTRIAGSMGAVPALGIGHLSGNGHVSWGDPDWQSLWPGRAGLWGAGDWLCCSIVGAGADSPGELTSGPGLSAEWEEPLTASGALTDMIVSKQVGRHGCVL